jgi:hypothetical protein
VHKGKGKARAPSIGEVIELSDWMLWLIKAFVWNCRNKMSAHLKWIMYAVTKWYLSVDSAQP